MDNKYRSFRERALKYRAEKARNIVEHRSILKKKGKSKRWIQKISTFFFGSKFQIYTKPSLSPADYAFMLINIHLNIRSFCRFADHTIDKGPLIVTIMYTLSHVVLCPPLCYLYGFLGRYGERSFINVWDMVPLLQGISVSVCLYECVKMIETCLLLSSAVIMVTGGFYTDKYMFEDTISPEDLQCGKKQTIYLGKGINYGLSRLFNNSGSTENDLNTFFGLILRRVYVVIGIWGTVLVLKFTKIKRIAIFIDRVMPLIIMLLLGGMVLVAVIYQHEYNLSYTAFTSAKNNTIQVYDYMHLVAFSITEYLPSHWITIGYLSDRALTKSQVMGTSIVSAIAGCGISYAIIFYLQDFGKAINMDHQCFASYGVHFFLVIVPYSIRYRCQSASLILIYLYVLIISFKALSHIAGSHKLLMWALTSWNHWIFRFRHLTTITTIVILGVSTVFFCTPDVHKVLLDIHLVAFYHTTMILFLLSIAGIAIYSIMRINADHQFLTGSEYPHITWLKFVFLIGLEVLLLYALSFAYEYRQLFGIDFKAHMLLAILLSPLILGAIKTVLLQKQYQGIILYPLSTWGRGDEESRDDRRHQNLRQMFVRRKRRECEHNCLSRCVYYQTEIDDEFRLRQLLLDAIEYEEDVRSTIGSIHSIKLSDDETTDKEDNEEFLTFKHLKNID